MINQVQSSTLYNYVAGLSGEQSVTIGGAPFTLVTRSTTAATYIEKATQYAYEHFQSLGLAVSYHTWQYSSSQRRNVVAEQSGLDPNCLYLLTAHLDDTSPTPNSQAPGADDNASGATGVLVAADILSRYQFTCTLRYVLFTGEEQGLLGSEAYARDAAASGDPILGVLNLDMIAYNTPGSPATIEMDIRSGQAGDQDRVLTNMVSGVIQAYQLNLTALVYASDDSGSDQYSFWMAGFPAVEVIEDWDDHTPYYHTTNDRVGTLNMPYFTAYVKAMVGAMAHLGKVTPSIPMPFHIYLPLVKQ
jgi:Zn-dependent M28 family amino/carboxypeptidase